jgi:hypothetical protein
MFGFKRFTFFAVTQVTPFLSSFQFTLPFSSAHVLDAHFDFWCDGELGGGGSSQFAVSSFAYACNSGTPFLACHVSVAIVISPTPLQATEWSFPQEFSYREAQFVGPAVSVTVRCSKHSHPFCFLVLVIRRRGNVSNLHRNVGTSNKGMLFHTTA